MHKRTAFLVAELHHAGVSHGPLKQTARSPPNDLDAMHASQYCCMRVVVALLLLLVMEVLGLTLRAFSLYCFQY